MNPEISLQYISSESMGYGRLGVNLAKEIVNAGVTVWTGLDSPNARDQDLNWGRPTKRTNVLAYVSVPSHLRGYWKGQHRVLFSMWESGRLPESFRDNLHSFDTVVVPSHHNQELFGRYHPDVRMVPLGIDPETWHPEERPKVDGEFRFLIAGSGTRKGTDLAYRAFNALWPKEGSWGSGPVPYLVMKNPRREEFQGPRVQVIGGKIPAAQEVDLYALAHCYLGPSRGEGFGLQPLQAMAQGCPTILTAAHGHDSFAHLGIGISAARSKAAYFVYGDAGEWWEPDFDELCDSMRWVYDNYDSACARALRSAVTVASDFTWARTAEGFLDAVGRDAMTVPYSGDGTWVEPILRRYKVVTTRDVLCTIAGHTYRFERGHEYLETADVKRILYENGSLDPSCVDPDGVDHGLAPGQLDDFEEYSAARSYCPTCGMRLGSQPTRADDLEEAMNGDRVRSH